MGTRRRDLEGPARHRLTDHVRKVGSAFGSGGASVLRRAVPGIGVSAIAGRFLAREGGRRLAEGTDRDHPDSGHQSRLVPVVEGSDDPRNLKVLREDRLGKGPADRTNRSVEGKFPRDHPPGQRLSRQDALCGQNRQGDRQVEKGTVLPQIGRRKVDGDLPAGEGESGIAHGGADPVVAFPDRTSGEPHDGVGGQPVGDVGFDFHGNRVDPEHGEGEGANEQGQGPPGRCVIRSRRKQPVCRRRSRGGGAVATRRTKFAHLRVPRRRKNGGHAEGIAIVEIPRLSRFARRNASSRASGGSGAGPKRSR